MKTSYKRSQIEQLFLIFFVPAVFFGYLIYKYPAWVFDDVSVVFFLGKSPSFWYATVYTTIVCGIALKVLLKNKSPYKKGKNNKLSPYQKKKFTSIFLCQLLFFFIIPFIIPALTRDSSFFSDPIIPPNKDAYIYVSRGFTSWGGFIYIFILVPLSVWYLGKRYCAWFCACGNLAETIGITEWGANWVKYKTPTGKLANKLEHLQTFFLFMGILFGFVLFFDLLKVFTAPNLLVSLRFYQDFVVDFIFGSVIGIAAYPFLGTRVWCRYGCPLAKMMELFGRYAHSNFKVAANDSCKGLNLCSQVCPMGIDVASYAHKDKKPINGSFGLVETPCIGCGGCVDICPVDALEFKPIIQ